MKKIRKTKIIGTIGPASESEEMLKKLMQAGLNVCRINFSHGGYEENASKIEAVKKCREELGLPIALALDTKGPEIRTGKMTTGNEKVEIVEGQEFIFVHDEIIGDNTKVHVDYSNLYQEVKIGDTILVDDGALEFEVKEIRDKDIVCMAKNTAKLGQRKSINIPGVALDIPALSEKDIRDITAGVKEGEFDFIFASFIRRADDVKQIRELLDANGGEHIGIISKIESQEGIENFDEILEVSDGIMVARGDMGIEIPLEDVPIVQKDFITKCNIAGKPVITATQMLESMITNPRPTRAEVSDVANAVYDQTSGIMLSGECAVGQYPVECVEDMNRISLAVEDKLHYWRRFESKKDLFLHNRSLKSDIAYLSCVTANEVEAVAIVAYTHTAESVNLISGFRPGCPIIAITDDKKTYYRLALTQNVTPILVEGEKCIDDTIGKGIDILEEKGILEQGDKIAISGGDKILPNKKESHVIGGIMLI